MLHKAPEFIVIGRWSPLVPSEPAKYGASAVIGEGEQAMVWTVLDGAGSVVTAVTRDAVRLGDGREVPSAVTIWTAGFGVPDLAARNLNLERLGQRIRHRHADAVQAAACGVDL